MAVYDHVLKTINSRKRAPFAEYALTMTGVDELRMFAGEYLDVDNVWELIAGRIQLTTDATVANRRVHLRQVTSIFTITENYGDNVAASTTTVHQLTPIRNSSNFATAPYMGIDRFSNVIWGTERYLWLNIDTGKAGDLVVARFLFRFLNWELGMELPWAITRWL